MSNNIEGKVVVITGASSGLGEATARLLSAQGASIVLGARRTGRIESLADELTGSGGKALAITTDVTHYDQVKKLVAAAVQSFGRIDVMINNAGLMPSSPLERLKIDDWNRGLGLFGAGDPRVRRLLLGVEWQLNLVTRFTKRAQNSNQRLDNYMSELTERNSFYVIVGSSAGAPIGLQFVVSDAHRRKAATTRATYHVFTDIGETAES